MSDYDIRAAYAREPGLRDDPRQRAVVAQLAGLQARLVATDSRWRTWRVKLPFLPSPTPVRGLYLWGGVGRGKTFLMDLFFETLALGARKRIHFHRMMRDVHQRLTALADRRDPLDVVAAQIAAEARVLCLDEFYVSDIGDAMILGRLLDRLFHRGVTLVTTSNLPPHALYADGLQRQRFLPAIRLLERHTTVVELDGGEDYRLALFKRSGTYLSPEMPETRARLERFLEEVAPGHIEPGRRLDINGRIIETVSAAKGVAWFTFAELCAGPRSQADYIEIARWYHTVLLSGVPRLTARDDNAARRFIALIDEFYDRRVKLVVAAAAGAADLYAGRRLRFEFRRTVSRLNEMQAEAYLAAAHRA